MLARAEKNAEKFCIQHVDEDCIRTPCLRPYCPKATVHLDKYGHVSPFMDAALIPRDHSADLIVPQKKVLYLRNMVWKAVSVEQMFQSVMDIGEHSMKQE